MIKIVIICILISALGACRSEIDNSSKLETYDEKKCNLIGNNPSKIYCATTYVQILADPGYYDGRRVIISGWGYSDGEITIIFPSEDSLLSVETNASILVYEENDIGGLSKYLLSRQHGAGRVVVGGMLRLRSSDPDAFSRFGVLEDSELIR